MASKQKTTWQDTVSDWLVSIIVAVALAFCIRTFIVEPYMVEGSSMYPTLVNHERLLVNKFTYFVNDPQKGEIIVILRMKAATLSNALSRRPVTRWKCATARCW